MKQLLSLLLCFTILACSKDDSKTMSLENEEEILNSIEGEWQYLEYWNTVYSPTYYSEVSDAETENIKQYAIKFSKDNSCKFIKESNKIISKYNFTIDVDKKMIIFNGWDFPLYVIVFDGNGNYTSLVGVKEIFIEEVNKEYLTIRCDKLLKTGEESLPAYAKLKRIK